MRLLREKWWSPLVTYPIVFIAIVVALPFFLHQVHHWHNLTFFLIGFFAVASLVVLSRVYNSPFKFILTEIILVLSLAVYSWPKEQLGNWNLQRSDHIIIWSLLGFLIAAAAESYLLNKKVTLIEKQ
jgi:hypothetical protein